MADRQQEHRSRYQEKKKKRAKEARALGLPAGTPYPIIWKVQQEKEGTDARG